MEKKRSLIFLVVLVFIASLFCGIFMTACFGKDDDEKQNETVEDKNKEESEAKPNEVIEQEDKRVFKFAELVGTISNPGIGYTATDWYHTKVGETPVHEKQGDIVLFFVDLGPFSAGANGTTDASGKYVEGVDYDLDEQFFTALRATFENCRNNGSTIAVRFRYDENGRSNPEPKTFEQVLKHVSQIKKSGVLEDYKDILMFVESGFVGQWGEQHGGKYTSVDYKAQLLSAMLDCVPSPIPVTVRTPDIFAKYVGIERKELANYKVKEGSDAARVGLYNDGYMGSNSDLGTYANREIETQWLSNQTFTSYFGGEFSGNIDFAKKYDTYLPENCIPEMYKTHLSYINGNIFQLYKDYTFDKKYDVEGFDNSAYYGQTVFQFIRDHLGYRFVLKEATFPQSVLQGENLEFSFSLVNNGFANPIKKQKCELIFEKDGNFIKTEVDLDPTKWYSGENVTKTLKIKLPAFLEAGEWKVYLKSSLGVDGLSQYNYRSIRFANKDCWNETLGANYLGFVEIKSSDAKITDNTFGEVGKNLQVANLYNLGGRVAVDGKISADEWNEKDIIASDENYSLYAKCDEENLYIAASLPHNSKSPVFNFNTKNPENGQSYWLYQQSNGFIYFNHDGDTGHKGMLLKYTDTAFEFKIPFYMLGIKNGSQLSEISVSVQDSSDSWKGKGSLKTKEPFSVKADFSVFNVLEKLTVESGSSASFGIETDAQIKNIVWYVNGTEITNNNTRTLTLENITKASSVSAKITSIGGTVKTVEIAEISLKS